MIKNWSIEPIAGENPEIGGNFLWGNVYGQPNISDGTYIKSLPIVYIDDMRTNNEHIIVYTKGDFVYELYKKDVDIRYFKKYYGKV